MDEDTKAIRIEAVGDGVVSGYRETYSELFLYLREELFVNPGVTPITELTARVLQGKNNLGVAEVRTSTKKHISCGLDSDFRDALHIIPNRKRKLLVYVDSLSMYELVKAYHALRE